MNNKKLKQSKDFQENNYYPSQISDSKRSTFYESFKKFTTHQKQSSLNQTSGKCSRVSKLLISSEKMKAIKCGGSPKINNKHSQILKENKNNNKTTVLDDDSYIQQISNQKLQFQGSNGKNSYLGTASPLVKQNKKQSSKQLLQQNFDEYFKENNNNNNKMKKKNKSLGNLFDKKKQITTTSNNNNNNNVNPAKSGQDLSFEQMAQYFNNMGLSSNRNSAINNSNNNFSSINVKKIDLVSNKSPQCTTTTTTDSTNFLTSRSKQTQQQQQQSQQSLNFKKLQQEEEGQEFSRYFQSKQQSVIKTDQKYQKTHKEIHQENQLPYKKQQLLRKKFKKQNKKLIKENSYLKQQLSLQSDQLHQFQSQHSQISKTTSILQLLLEFSTQLSIPPPSSSFLSPSISFILHQNDFVYFEDKLLGRGGFGEVYQGKLFQTKDVAVKILKINVSEEQIRFLQGELIAMIVCEHKTLVKLHGVCLERQKSSNSTNNNNNNNSTISLTVYIIMELLITDLRKLIFHQTKIHLPRFQKYRLLLQILTGLHTLHQQNYVHCDLKMQNVLLDSKLNAKISDFGLSKSLASGKTKQTVTGGFSERNSAFEYLVEDKVSTKGDIWSFGILMYELLKEKIAWSGLTGPQTVAKVSIQTPFYSCNQKIGDETDNIIENCLNYDHSKRPSAEMLIHQIQELMDKA